MVLKKMVLKKIVLILVIIVLFCIGFGMGIFYQAQKDRPSLERGERIFKSLSLKAIPSISAYAQVKEVRGNELILFYEDEEENLREEMRIKVKNDTNIFYFSVKTEEKKDREANFADIKSGSWV